MRRIFPIPFIPTNSLSIRDCEDGMYVVSEEFKYDRRWRQGLYYNLKCNGCGEVSLKSDYHFSASYDYYSYCTYKCARLHNECGVCFKQLHKGACKIKCPLCEKMLPFSKYAKDTCAKRGLKGYCIKCNRAYQQKHYKENPELPKARALLRYKENREELLKTMAVYREAHKDEELSKVKNCSDDYIRGLIACKSSFKREDIPDSFVELYREKVLLGRIIKEIKQKEKE